MELGEIEGNVSIGSSLDLILEQSNENDDIDDEDEGDMGRVAKGDKKYMQLAGSPKSPITNNTGKHNVTPSVNPQQQPPMSKEQVSPPTDDPRKYTRFSPRHRQFIVFIISIAGLLSPLSINIYLPAVRKVEQDLNTTASLVNASVSSFTLAMGIAPLFWGSFSDMFGRKRIYLVALSIYIIATFGCALTRSVEFLIFVRFLQAIGSSAVISLGAGTLSDIFPINERGRAMGFFFMGPLFGPIFAPVIGGNMAEAFGWQSVFWFLFIYGVLITILIALFLPETKMNNGNNTNNTAIVKSAAMGNTQITKPTLKEMFTKPFKNLLLLKEQRVHIPIIYICFLFVALYSVTTTLSRRFMEIYGFSTAQVGNCFLGYGIGNLLGSQFGGYNADRVLSKLKTKHGVKDVPKEWRLHGILIGSIIAPIALFGHGLFLSLETHWILPILADFFVGFGKMMVFTTISTYLVDLFPHQSASITGVNNCCRSLAAAVTSLVAYDLELVVGSVGYYSVLAVLLAVNGGVTFHYVIRKAAFPSSGLGASK